MKGSLGRTIICLPLLIFILIGQNLFQEIVGSSTQKHIRNESELIMLPRQLWCSLKESDNGETCGEVGWLLDPGFAISSRCIFSSDGKLKVCFHFTQF